jgi:hypothetical protein
MLAAATITRKRFGGKIVCPLRICPGHDSDEVSDKAGNGAPQQGVVAKNDLLRAAIGVVGLTHHCNGFKVVARNIYGEPRK